MITSGSPKIDEKKKKFADIKDPLPLIKEVKNQLNENTALNEFLMKISSVFRYSFDVFLSKCSVYA